MLFKIKFISGTSKVYAIDCELYSDQKNCKVIEVNGIRSASVVARYFKHKQEKIYWKSNSAMLFALTNFK